MAGQHFNDTKVYMYYWRIGDDKERISMDQPRLKLLSASIAFVITVFLSCALHFDIYDFKNYHAKIYDLVILGRKKDCTLVFIPLVDFFDLEDFL